jgi:hypothetical protein
MPLRLTSTGSWKLAGKRYGFISITLLMRRAFDRLGNYSEAVEGQQVNAWLWGKSASRPWSLKTMSGQANRIASRAAPTEHRRAVDGGELPWTEATFAHAACPTQTKALPADRSKVRR